MKKMISRRNLLKDCAVAGSAVALSACGGNREQFLAQRSARRECRPRHEADAGHRKRF